MSSLTDKYKQMMTMSDEESEEIKDDQSTLQFTQKVRRVMVRELTKEGMPSDNETMSLVLTTLNSMDRTSLSRMKIGVEQSAVDNDKSIIEMATRLRDYTVKPGQRDVVREELPTIDTTQLPEAEYSDGQKHIGLVDESAEDFMRRYEKENPISIRTD